MKFLVAAAVALSEISQGGWHAVEGTNNFSDVAISKEMHDQIVAETNSKSFWGGSGSPGVLTSWNSAAFDRESNTMYFYGGGHFDYGGNEVYALNLDTLTWARISEPSPLLVPEAHSATPSKNVYVPLEGPLPTHTYDGFVWNPITKSFWTASRHGFTSDPALTSHSQRSKGVWEFTPSTQKWTHHDSEQYFWYPMSEYIPSREQMLFVDFYDNKYHRAFFYNADGSSINLGKIEGLEATGVSTMFSNPVTGELYSSHTEGIYKLHVTDDAVTAEFLTAYPSIEEAHYASDYRQASINYRNIDGKFYIWNGGAQIITWDPVSNEFEVIWDESDNTPLSGKTGNGRIFEKFTYLPELDLFFGLAHSGSSLNEGGLWAWKPRTNTPNINSVRVSDLKVDITTQTSASLFLPILGGDKNFNAAAQMHYRKSGSTEWKKGVDLMRVRPDITRNTKNSTGVSESGFAGMLTGLDISSDYEVKVTLTDPDGVSGEATHIVQARTQALPTHLTSNVVRVSDATQLKLALSAATPGTTIELAPGLYSGQFELNNSGAEGLPISITGLVPHAAIIDGQNKAHTLKISGSHIRVTNLTFTNVASAIKVTNNSEDVAIYKNVAKDVVSAVHAKGGHKHLYIADNDFEGRVEFGNLSSETWNYEGIVVTGQGIEIANNAVSGFGDAIGLHWDTNLSNKGINIHHNLIKWTGDDGIEFDFSLRNVAAHHNIVANSANALSFQPVWGGPVYAFRNIMINQARGPIKIKPEKDHPNGMYIVHNTIIKDDAGRYEDDGQAWGNTSGHIKQLYVLNNLFVSAPSSTAYTLKNGSNHMMTEMDYNGWTANGRFAFNLTAEKYGVSADNFDEWKRSSLGNNDILMSSDNLFANYEVNLASTTFADYRETEGLDLSLSMTSDAVDAGKTINGLNDNFNGNKPDLGALEVGESMFKVGPRVETLNATTPIAIDDFVSTEVNSTVEINPLENDFRPNNNVISLAQVIPSENVAVSINADNVVTIMPSQNFIGITNVEYEIVDIEGHNSIGKITLEVTPPNVAPIANKDTISATEGQSQVIPFVDLLENDTDAENHFITVIAVTQAAQGQVELLDGAIVYTPRDGFVGRDSFDYTISDVKGATASAKVEISVIADGALVGTSNRDTFDITDSQTGLSIYGRSGHDIIYGSQFDDIISGGSHEDNMKGYGGNDIFLYEGDNNDNDWIDGGEGYDKILGNDQDNYIGLYSVTNVEEIDGGLGYDIIIGARYAQLFDFTNVLVKNIEMIDGGAHDDTIFGSQGNDNLKGSSGNDYLDGNGGVDTAWYEGNAADYNISTNNGMTTVTAKVTNEGEDVLFNIEFLQFADTKVTVGEPEPEVVEGTKYRDTFDVSTSENAYVIYGLAGPDIITGSAKDDVIVGGAHEDHMNGGAGNDTFKYVGDNDKNDWIDGGEGFDTIEGNEQNNLIALYSVKNVEKIDGGLGYDVIMGARYQQVFDFRNVDVINVELIDGGSHDDIIFGSKGNDVLKGSNGNDQLDGHDGTDIAVFDMNAADYEITVSGSQVTVKALNSYEGTDTLTNVEVLRFADGDVQL
ncbi:Ig-like domain-containing protein [Aestuariibacter sp. AA17]|uniref:Ig-like domain-containing protein n=1 Tax=Fluctibacter corallii TaxID=2984329 RepID=A0ABT3ABI7_9ALTE|nr:Ig-like domain-containing protein [Aestuariibacter sp. AA17]MCV2886035.1 Ig-like domain-containing protein [Aestuariibacter sp. AA17]